MTDFLLEIRCEEIPARMQVKASEDLARLFGEELGRAGLTPGAIDSFVTPRRLALIARDFEQAFAIAVTLPGRRAIAFRDMLLQALSLWPDFGGKFKGMPVQIKFGPVFQRRHRTFQLAVSDDTPRADHIGNNVDTQLCLGHVRLPPIDGERLSWPNWNAIDLA